MNERAVTTMILRMAHVAMQTAMASLHEVNGQRSANVIRHVSQAITLASDGHWDEAIGQFRRAAKADGYVFEGEGEE